MAYSVSALGKSASRGSRSSMMILPALTLPLATVMRTSSWIYGKSSEGSFAAEYRYIATSSVHLTLRGDFNRHATENIPSYFSFRISTFCFVPVNAAVAIDSKIPSPTTTARNAKSLSWLQRSFYTRRHTDLQDTRWLERTNFLFDGNCIVYTNVYLLPL